MFLVDHFYDLRQLDELKLDKFESEDLRQHIEKICTEIQESLQPMLDSLVLWVNMFPIDEKAYLESELERAFYQALFDIKDNILPESMVFEENARINIDMGAASKWSERLSVCTQHWGMFLLLLNEKIINSYQNEVSQNVTTS